MKHSNRRISIYETRVNKAEALAAALFSVLITAATIYGIYSSVYGMTMTYADLIAGKTTIDGYFKQGDMWLFYAVYLVMPLSFALGLVIARGVRCVCKKMQGRVDALDADIATKPCDIPGEHVDKQKVETGVSICVANRHALRQEVATILLRGFVLLILGIEAIRALATCGVSRFVEHSDVIAKVQFVGIVVYAVVWTIFTIFTCVSVSTHDTAHTSEADATDQGGVYPRSCHRMAPAWYNVVIKYFTYLISLCFPFAFLGYYKFYYDYETLGSIVLLYSSTKWKYTCLVLFALTLGWQLYRIYRKKTDVGLVTLILMAMLRVAETPAGLLSADFFHNGEMALPMQQLLSYGKLPYFDLDPIHGLCDYFYSAMNVLFFDGTYFAQNAATFVTNLVVAAAVAFDLAISLRSQGMRAQDSERENSVRGLDATGYLALTVILLYSFIPFLIEASNVRTFVFVMGLFILQHRWVKADVRRTLFAWVLLCIVGITWNVSIGASFAVAFLPMVLYRCIKELWPRLRAWSSWQIIEKKTFAIAYGLLILCGLCYVPLFLQILRFLSENAGATLITNGTGIFTEYYYTPAWTYGIFLPFLITIYLWLVKKKSSYFVAMFTCLWVISSYMCVRYDAGARIGVFAVIFAVWMVGILWEKRAYLALLACLGLMLWSGRDAIIDATTVAMAPKTIASSLESNGDLIFYTSGEAVGLPNLGSGFILGNTLTSLKNMKAVFEAELGPEDTYVDLTNMIADYVIFDSEAVISYTSAYNISTTEMMEKALSEIEETNPKLILLAPYIRFDQLTVSVRSLYLFKHLIAMGYEPYVYEDVLYLVLEDAVEETTGDGVTDAGEAVDADVAADGATIAGASSDGVTDAEEVTSANASQGRIALGYNTHQEDLGYLPYFWGNATQEAYENLRLYDVAYDLTFDHASDTTTITMTEEALDGMTITFLEVTTTAVEGSMRLTYHSDVDDETHGHLMNAVSGDGDTTTYLIPVGSSAFWQYSQIEEISIWGPEVLSVRFVGYLE